MSPACPGRLLIDCTSGEADQLRELIRQKIGQGRNKAQIIDDLVDMYGIAILASPPKEGFYLTAWVLPFLALLYGVLMLLLAVRALSRRKHTPPQEEGGGDGKDRQSDNPYRKRLEEELKEFEY
jgi:cytochrome c-type biogenesis protein CcmH